VKAALVVLAFLLAASGMRVPVWFAGSVRSVPLPVLAAVVILAALAVLAWLIVRVVRRDGFGLTPCGSVTP
jgi:hypothetical protein